MMNTNSEMPTPFGIRHSHERGSALVLTLGILALLLISAMVFVFTANTEREAASVNADVAKARLLAKAKMELALAYIYHTSVVFEGVNNYHLPYPGTSSIMGKGTVGDWQNIWHVASAWSTTYDDDLDAPFHLDLGFDYTPKTNNSGGDMFGTPSWQPFLDHNGQIIGRATFLIIDEAGKLDPNGLINPESEPFLDLDGDGSRQITEPFYNWDGSLAAGQPSFTNSPIPEGLEKRHGYLAAEIDLGAGLLGPNNLNVAIPPTVPATTVPSYFKDRRHATTQPWQSWRQMFAADYGGSPLINQGSPSLTNDVLAMKYCLFPRSFDKEAFHSGGTDYQRFSVGTFDWSFPGIPLPAVPPYSPGYTARVNSLIGLANPWNGSISSSAIPWLATMTGGGTIPDVDLRKQVAANLIDYNDSDDVATTDFAGPDYTAASIATGTYCGLEKVAYINEVHVQVVEDDPDFDPGTANDYVFTVHVELANIYDTDFINGMLDLHIQFSWPVGVVPTVPGTGGAIQSATTAGIALNWSGVVCNANSYTAAGTMSASFTYGGIPSGSTLTITGVAARLSVGSDLVDAAIINQTGTNRPQAISLGTTYQFNFAVDDPRCNLHAAYWSYSTGASTIGNRNTQATAQGNPSAAPGSYGDARDIEVINDVALGISTAYIRNGPMMSLWELGAIHRGEPFRTFNLQAFDDGTTGTAYGDGDGMLLDQCCVGPEKTVRGRFNPNSPVYSAWFAMLSKIAVNTGYDHAAVGTVLTPGGGNNIDTAVTSVIAATTGIGDGTTALKSRGQIAALAALQTANPAQTTDAAREEVIGKIANLLTTRQNYFRVLVTAQAVKDLGAVPESLPAASRQRSWQEMGSGRWVDVLAEVKQMAIVRRDAHTNAFIIEQLEDLE